MLKDILEKHCDKLQDSLFKYSNAKIGESGEDLRYGIVMQFETVIAEAIAEALAEVNNFKYVYIVSEKIDEYKSRNQDYKEGFRDGINGIADTIEKNIKQYLEGEDGK
jgi:hypothetical protein